MPLRSKPVPLERDWRPQPIAEAVKYLRSGGPTALTSSNPHQDLRPGLNHSALKIAFRFNGVEQAFRPAVKLLPLSASAAEVTFDHSSSRHNN